MEAQTSGTVSVDMATAPLLLLHGGGPGVDAGGNWLTVHDRLARLFECLAPDLLGFGTQLPAAGASLPQGPVAWARARAEQVLAVIEREGFDRVHLVGNSAAGGAAALMLMSIAPQRIARAVVMGGAGTGPLPGRAPFYDEPSRASMRSTLERLLSDQQEHGELLDELTERRWTQAMRPRAEDAFRAMFAADPDPVLAPDLAAITCPVLALHGEQDRVSPVAVSERLVETLPNARLEVVAGAGHWIHVDRPDAFCAAVEEFLSA